MRYKGKGIYKLVWKAEEVLPYFYEDVGAGIQGGGTSFCKGPRVGRSLMLEKVNNLTPEEEQTWSREFAVDFR